MDRAADAVAELIRSQVASGRRTWWACRSARRSGCATGTEPKLVDRAVLCGTVINTMPGVCFTRFLLGTISRNTIYRWVIHRYRNVHHAPIPSANIEDYREDLRLITGAQFANIVVAPRGSPFPKASTNQIRPHYL